MADIKSSKPRKLASAVGALAQVFTILMVIAPELIPAIRAIVAMIWPLLIAAGSALLIWGQWPQIGKYRRFVRYLIGGMPVLVVIAWLGWPWPRIASIFHEQEPVTSTVPQFPPIENPYWTEEWPTIDFIQARIGDYGAPPPDYKVRELIAEAVRDGLVQAKWLGAQEDSWRTMPPLEAMTLCELDKYGPEAGLDARSIYGRLYWSEHIRNINWKERLELSD